MALQSVEGLATLDARPLRERLAASGYDAAFLGEVETVAPLNLDRPRRPLLRWFLARRPGPAADLAALFSYFEAVPAERIEAALGAMTVRDLSGAGVLEPAGDGRFRSRFMLVPHADMWFLSDPLFGGGDAVMGPGMTTLILHRLLEELPGASVLDLGCGAGSLAVAAARRGARAVAADVSPRALAIAGFNARLNGAAIELALGDGIAPVRGRAFDLVLSQPPYLPRPEGEAETTYLHGGRYGDELAMRFVAEAARALAPGGIAALHFDSVVRAAEPLPERLRLAVGDAPAELLALVSPGPPPDLQAMFYAGMDHPDLGESFERVAIANREHLAALGVTEVSRVLAVLRHPGGAPPPGGRYRIVLQAPPVNRLRPGAVREALAGLDLASGPDEALLAARLAPPADATFVGEWRSPADASPSRLEVRFARGSMAQDRELGERGWVMCGLFDGTRTVAEVIAPYAAALEAPASEVADEVLGFVRDALARGLLRVAPAAGRA